MPNSSARRTQMPQVLLPGSDAREPGRQGRRHGFAKYFLADAKFFTPNAKTDSMAWTRQDLRNDKIGTDQGRSDVPPTPNQVLLTGCDKIYFRCPRPIPSNLVPVEP